MEELKGLLLTFRIEIAFWDEVGSDCVRVLLVFLKCSLCGLFGKQPDFVSNFSEKHFHV